MLNLPFEIGFDHFRFGLPLNIAQFADQHRVEVRNGYSAARLQQVTQRKADMFEKKLLSIRDRALNKGLSVTINCDDLRHAFNKTQGICPVTLLPFTFAENNDTDWSVDRIDNRCGYDVGNIVIVSAQVNRAKNDFDLASLIKLALEYSLGLRENSSNLDWYQLARFYFKKMHLVKPLNFCQILNKCQFVYEQLLLSILLFNKSEKSKPILKQLAKYFNKATLDKLARTITRKIYHRNGFTHDILSKSQKLQDAVRLLINTMNSHSQEFNNLLIHCVFA